MYACCETSIIENDDETFSPGYLAARGDWSRQGSLSESFRRVWVITNIPDVGQSTTQQNLSSSFDVRGFDAEGFIFKDQRAWVHGAC